jgi:hypothetical protein
MQNIEVGPRVEETEKLRGLNARNMTCLKGSYKVEGSFCDFRKHMVFFVKMGWPARLTGMWV